MTLIQEAPANSKENTTFGESAWVIIGLFTGSLMKTFVWILSEFVTVKMSITK